jgi:hypothetical protein
MKFHLLATPGPAELTRLNTEVDRPGKAPSFACGGAPASEPTTRSGYLLEYRQCN